MVILRFRNDEEHQELLKKVKKMKKFAEEIEYCLEDSMEDDYNYRGGGSYRKDDEDYYRHEPESRYSRMSRGGR